MAQKIQIKRSGTTGVTPAVAELDYGELAINYADGKLFYKKDASTVKEISGAGGTSSDLFTSETFPTNSFIKHSAETAYTGWTIGSVGGMGIILDTNNNDTSSFFISHNSADIDTATKLFEVSNTVVSSGQGVDINTGANANMNAYGNISTSNGAFRIGTTTVIDSGRNLSNIKDITGSRTNTSTTGSILRNTIPEVSIEDSPDLDYRHYNLLAGADKRYTVTATKNGSAIDVGGNMFRGDSIHFGNAATSSDIYVITVEGLASANYTAYVGINFGSGNFRAKSVKIETYRNGAWQTECDLTNQSKTTIVRQVSGNNSNGVTKVRYTLTDANTTSLRINNLFLLNYNTSRISGGYEVSKFDDTTKYGDLTLKGDREFYFNVDDGNLYIKPNTGGWATGLRFKGSSGTNRGGFGAYGQNDALTYFYVGSAYDDSGAFRVYANGQLNIGTNTILDSSRNATFAKLTLTSNNDTIVTNHAAMRRGSSGEAYIDAPGHIVMNIDTNNNNTDRYFAVRTNASSSNVFRVNESGELYTSKQLRVGSQTSSDACLQASTNGDTSIVRFGSLETENHGEDILVRMQGRNNSGSPYYGDVKFDPHARKLFITSYHSDGDQLVLTSNANVGFSTTNPSQRVHIAGGGLQIDGNITTPSSGVSAFLVDYSQGNSRYWSRGVNATTRGSHTFYSLENDGGNQITSLTLDTAGRMLVGSSSKGSMNGGTIIAGDSSSVGGGVGLALRYGSSDTLNVFGAMYSSAHALIGYGVRSSTTTGNTFLSTADNSNFTRGALTVGDQLIFRNAAAQTTTVGDEVTMTERFKVDASGNLTASGALNASGRLTITDDTAGDGSWQGGILVKNTNSTAGEPAIAFQNTSMGGNYWIVGSNQDNELHFSYGTGFTDANTKMILKSDGKLGVSAGAGTLTEKLTVYGAITSTYQASNFSAGPYRASMDIVDSSKIVRIGSIKGTNTPSGDQGEVQLLVNGSVKAKFNTNSDLNLVSGGYQINSTTVIDASRNLTNISHISQPETIRPNVRWGASGSSTGQVRIRLPGTSSNYDMVNIHIDVYEYNSTAGSQIVISGHNWTTGWYNNRVTVIGGFTKPIYLAREASDYYILLGDVDSGWTYGTVNVTKVTTASFYNVQDWDNGWNITQSTSALTTTHITSNLNSSSSNTLQTAGYVRAGGFRINGSTVIDSSSNLTNIGTITASGSFTGSGADNTMYGGLTGRLRVGRSSGQNLDLYVDDNNCSITADQDSDGNGSHNFILNRSFDGTGANNFVIQKGGTDQLLIDGNGSATLTGPSVGESSGDVSTHLELLGSRHDIIFKQIRTSAGSDWNNTTFRIQARVDTTNHQAIDFTTDGSYKEHIDFYTGNLLHHSRFNQNGNLDLKRGAYQMNGTTVLSSARELQNVSIAPYISLSNNTHSSPSLNADDLAETLHSHASVLQDSLQGNVMAFKPPRVYAKSGSTWTDLGLNNDITDGKMAHDWSGLTLSRSYSEFIIYFGSNLGYSFLNAVTMMHSTNGNSMRLIIETHETAGATDTGWNTRYDTVSNVGSWPGSTVMRRNINVGGGFDNLFRIRIIPNWSHASNTISIGQITATAGYGSYSRLFNWDVNKNIALYSELTLPSTIKATETNLKLWAGGNHILNMDLNGKIYPQTDNTNDLGFSSTTNRFRDLHLSGLISVSGTTVIDSSRNINGETITGDKIKTDKYSISAPRYDCSFYVLQSQHWYGHSGSQVMYLGESSNNIRTRGKMRVGSNADVDSGYRFQVDGSVKVSDDILASGNVTAYSDINLKDNITNIDNALEKVNAIRGVTYDRIDQDNTRHAGVIAQEVEEVLPEVVHTDDEGIKSVAYGNMVGLLIEAIKEQQTQINELKAQIDTLKGEK